MPKTQQLPSVQAQERLASPQSSLAVAQNTPPKRFMDFTPERGFKGRKRKMLLALKEVRGIVTHAAQLATISVRTHYFWVKKDPKYAEAAIQARDEAREAQAWMAQATILEIMSGGKTEQARLHAAELVLSNFGDLVGFKIKTPGTAVQVNTQTNVRNGPIWQLAELLKKPEKEE